MPALINTRFLMVYLTFERWRVWDTDKDFMRKQGDRRQRSEHLRVKQEQNSPKAPAQQQADPYYTFPSCQERQNEIESWIRPPVKTPIVLARQFLRGAYVRQDSSARQTTGT